MSSLLPQPPNPTVSAISVCTTQQTHPDETNPAHLLSQAGEPPSVNEVQPPQNNCSNQASESVVLGQEGGEGGGMLDDIDGQGDRGMDDGSHEVVEVNMANRNNEDE